MILRASACVSTIIQGPREIEDFVVDSAPTGRLEKA